MRTLFRSGETNVPAVLLSTGFLILCIAVAYYVIVVIPFSGNNTTTDQNISSASSSVMISSAAMTDDSDTASARSMTPSEQAAYDGCINAATQAHNQRWSNACNDKKELQESAYLACIQNNEDDSYCTAQFGGYQNIGSDCDLGLVRMNSLNLQYTAAKQACSR